MFSFFIVCLLIPNFVLTLPTSLDTTESIIVTTDFSLDTTTTQENEKAIKHLPPELKSMHINSNVSNRYAHTIVSSRYKNPAAIAQETKFSITLPDTAFISRFTMEIKGKVYEAYVKEKEEAKREYDEAIQSGLGAAHVELSARDSNTFTVSVNVEPRAKVTFNLSYEELLVRKHGKYEMVINLHPGQLVKDFVVNVLVNETKALKNVATPALRSGNEVLEENLNKTNEYATVTPIGEDGHCVQIRFAPTVQQQKEMAKKLQAQKAKLEEPAPWLNYGGEENVNKKQKNLNDLGLSGQFIIEYDVERNTKGGDIIVNDGYFVHFFAPSDLKPLPKHAVFVLDVSGSMGGRKIEQLKQAMLVILDELNPEDYFNLVEFSSGAKVWNFDNTSASSTYYTNQRPWYYTQEEEKNANVPFELPPAYPATAEYKEIAKNITHLMEAGGGTNIYDALKVALNLTSQGIPEDKTRKNKPQPIIIFLTDGEATDGETDPKVIFNTVDELNNNKSEKAAIFSLAFGYDAHKEFLKKLSLRNLGFMRQIYEASDAALQLQDFYKQISSPLLSNVTFKYPEGQVESITKHSFHTLFDGAEFIVAGKMESSKDKILYVHGLTYDGPIDFTPVIIPIPNPKENIHQIGALERLWAYVTIKQLLDKKDEISAVDTNSTEAEDLKKQALKLALKYSFVTPITSLVVVKPNETEKVDTAEAPRSYDQGFGYAPVAFSAPASLSGAGGYGGGFSGFGTGGISTPATFYYSSRSQDNLDYFNRFDKSESENETTTNNLIPWLSFYQTDNDTIILEGTNYSLGNNETLVDEKPCLIQQLNVNGTCTLLTKCPKIYGKLDTFNTYFTKYFCVLEPNYAAVCCADTDMD